MREDLRKLFAVAIVTASGVAFAGTDSSASSSSARDSSASSESSMSTEPSASATVPGASVSGTISSESSSDPALSDPSGTTPNESMEDRSLGSTGTSEPLASGDQGTQVPGILPGERAGEPVEPLAGAAGSSDASAIDCSVNADDLRCPQEKS